MLDDLILTAIKTCLVFVAVCVFASPGEVRGQTTPDVAANLHTISHSLDGLATSECCCEGCSHRRSTLTGEWHGLRPLMEDTGVEFEAVVSQFMQGVVSGGVERRLRYAGHGDYDMIIDFEKLGFCDRLELLLGAEHRFGETANLDTGSVVPVALLPNLPEPETDHLALTKVRFTYKVADDFKLFFGKLDTLEYDTNEFASGNGRDRFFSTAFNYNPIATRTIPFSTLGAGFNVMRDGNRLITVAVVNTEDTPTTVGFNELFADGVAMFAELRLPVEIGGLRGHQMVGGSWSTREYVSLRQDGRIEFPDITINRRQGSWAVYWNADQYLWQDPCDPSRGWGVFGRAGISDGNPNPIRWFLSFGVGGHSPFANREDDLFGIGWYYNGLSDEFGPILSNLLNDGQGIELFYDIAITEYLRVAPDLQVVDPNRTVDWSLVAGVRVRADF